jgi:lactocepin
VASVVAVGAFGSVIPVATADPADPTTPPGQSDSSGADSTAERVRVLVLMKDQPSSPSTRSEMANVQEQDALLEDWEDDYGLDADRQFGYLVNGFSATIPEDQIGALSLEKQVQSVRRERVYERTEHSARQAEGVPAAAADHDVDGTGTVVAVLDTGVDPTHQDMRLDDGVCEDSKLEVNTDPSAAEAGFTCKVPNGYNYADENYEITDTSAEPHGMHVSGIVAANGAEGDASPDVTEDGRIDGVAPNAQILAMKVFSNSGGGAQDSDIIAAIEDSVKMDADVLNLSLGSPNGQKNSSDGASIAIQKARANGVITVIAAGNDGLNFSPTGVGDDYFGLADDGTVGSPGTQGSAFTVASIDNTTVTSKLAYVASAGGEDVGITYALASGEPDDEARPIVDLGLATAEEVEGQDLSGSWALVTRGDITFTEKYANVLTTGAYGIIVVNTDDQAFGMAGIEDYADFPGVALTKTAGDTVKVAVAEGDTTFRVTSDLSVDDYASALQPSSFTSWGATPSLDFEPEIAGIGGSVYSTYNDDAYGTMSGTSMASPNVAGMSALALEYYSETYPDLTGPQRVDLVKTSLMNTALVPEHDGVPYSPRQIGAGLGQIDQALDSEVTATVDGEASVALREVDGPRSFTVSLTNLGDEEREYTIPAQSMVQETDEAGENTDTVVSDGSLTADASTVTVPAGGTAEVTFTVAPGSGSQVFIGGWARFEAATDGEPDLAVPFLGFVGDWDAEDIVLGPGEEYLDGLGLTTEMTTSIGGQALPIDTLGEGSELWLSPNGDDQLDTVAPALVLMRNASDAEYQVLDADGNVIQTTGQEQGLYREILGDVLTAADEGSLGSVQWSGANFTGEVWDPQAAQFTAVPDGRYTYRVKTRLTEDSAWQITDLEFGVDGTAPTITASDVTEDGEVTIQVSDGTGSGLIEAPVAALADGTEVELTRTGPEGDLWTAQVDPETATTLTIEATDLGLNTASTTVFLDGSSLLVPQAGTTGQGTLYGTSDLGTYLTEDGELLVYGYVSGQVDSVAITAGDGKAQAAEVDEGTFQGLTTPLGDGTTEITVEAFDGEGNSLDTVTFPVTLDRTAPKLALEFEEDSEGSAVVADDGTILVTGTITDEREGATLSLQTDAGDEIEVAQDGSFETTIDAADESVTSFTLVASDGKNTSARTVLISGREAAVGGISLPVVTNASCSWDSRYCIVPGDTPDTDGESFTLRGELGEGIGSIEITPAGDLDEDGKRITPETILAEIAEDGTWSATFPVQTGENHVRVVMKDEEGNTVYDAGVRVLFDITAPTLETTEPTLIGGTLFTDTVDVTFAGTASDDGWGYTFMLNGSTVIERFDLGSPGEESNKREFSTTITVADEDFILVNFFDSNGNELLNVIPVVLDQEAPALAFDGVKQDQLITKDGEITATATEGHPER